MFDSLEVCLYQEDERLTMTFTTATLDRSGLWQFGSLLLKGGSEGLSFVFRAA
jgi:hypothetical protein